MRADARHGRSIRIVLLAGTAATLLVVLGAAAWLSFEGSQDEAQELFDARLATSARVLEALVARPVEGASIESPIVIRLPGPLEASDHDVASALGHYYETKIAFQVWANDRHLLVRSASAPSAPFAPLEAGFSDQRFEGQPWRVFTLHANRTWIQVAERDDVRSELADKLALAAVVPLLAGAVVLLIMLALLIRYGLAPLGQLALDIAARQPDSMATFDVECAPKEIQPVLEALNGLQSRVRVALERERRFTADAAHELRTPLAALKVHAQNLARASTPAARQASLEQMLAGLDRTIHLAEQMLALSRATAAGEPAMAEISLRDLVVEAIENMQPSLRERELRVSLVCEPPDSPVVLLGDRQKLASLVGNLLDNAARHAPARSMIDVALRQQGGEIALTVADRGPGIPPELRERVFESYYRIPGTAGAGSGLGLAIVKEVAQLHRARAEIAEGADGSGARVSVRFATQ